MLTENYSLHDGIENRPSLLFNKYQSQKWWTLLHSILHDFENGLPFAINHLRISSKGFAINLEWLSHEIQITKRLFPNIFNILYDVGIITVSTICLSCFNKKFLWVFHDRLWNNIIYNNLVVKFCTIFS